MRRVWLGMAVGWGALLLYAVVAFGVVVLRSRDRAEARWTAALTEESEQGEALRKLDTLFAFRAPGKDEVLALDEERLGAYLDAREEALTAFEKLERGNEKLEEDQDADAESDTVEDGLEVAGRRAELNARMQAALERSLRKRGMSPSEFRAIT
ncbi:MAG: hypothetical protein L0Y64_25165, partial [Myxococcaceae bacterium]|nr:hypothetical protein [Myxococcaceae bacterium]